MHTVQSGDTAWNISRRYGISVDQLAAANGGLTTVKLGARIVIPGASAPQSGVQLASLDPQAGATSPIPVAAPPVPPAVARQSSAFSPLAEAQAQRQQVAVAPQTGAAGALAPAAPEPAAATSGFRWPVRGRIISGFGKKPNGERNDGINLAVPEGTAVKAAEDGTVIYAGNELKSYGNLVLIRHAGGWVSAYAHNGELKVKRGDEVRRGQVIALSGMSGGVTTPQVHFELRKDAAPVDPLQHLSET
jgi:murein DD-endopeptidase MepM/ murein hydrolase activator NlpD